MGKKAYVVGNEITNGSQRNPKAEWGYNGGNFSGLNKFFKNILWKTEFYSQCMEQHYKRGSVMYMMRESVDWCHWKENEGEDGEERIVVI